MCNHRIFVSLEEHPKVYALSTWLYSKDCIDIEIDTLKYCIQMFLIQSDAKGCNKAVRQSQVSICLKVDVFITDHMCNVFSHVCDSVHSGWGSLSHDALEHVGRRTHPSGRKDQVGKIPPKGEASQEGPNR